MQIVELEDPDRLDDLRDLWLALHHHHHEVVRFVPPVRFYILVSLFFIA